MNAVSLAVITGVVVMAGNGLGEKEFDARQLIGTFIYALMLSAMNEVNPKIAARFAALVLVGALLVQGPKVLDGLNLSKDKK